MAGGLRNASCGADFPVRQTSEKESQTGKSAPRSGVPQSSGKKATKFGNCYNVAYGLFEGDSASTLRAEAHANQGRYADLPVPLSTLLSFNANRITV